MRADNSREKQIMPGMTDRELINAETEIKGQIFIEICMDQSRTTQDQHNARPYQLKCFSKEGGEGAKRHTQHYVIMYLIVLISMEIIMRKTNLKTYILNITHFEK